MASTYQLLKLEEICFLITDGKHGDCDNEANSSYYFLSAKDIKDGRLVYDNARQITKLDFLETHKRTRLEPFDILISNSGTIGKIAIARDVELTHRTTFQKSVAILKPNSSRVNPFWFYYSLNFEQERLINTAVGTAQKNLLLRDLREFKIRVPPLPTQRKIAAILSAYDDLIENNTRRIRILEAMAQAIYREWFVNFRYPGHEGVRLIESPLGPIPEGWEVKTVGEVLASIESGSRPKGGIDANESDMPSIGAENIIGLGKYDYSKEKFVSREFFEKMNHGHVQSYDVLLYKDGAQIGRKSIFGDGFPHQECCINEHVFILRTNNLCNQEYLYFWLDRPDVTQNIINLNSNAAQPGINQAGVKGLDIILPSKLLLNEFRFYIKPILSLIFKLALKNKTLVETRDLLLPRLISGELDVEALEIPTL